MDRRGAGQYVTVNSNHPDVILKSIPKGINKRLNVLSSSKEIFDRNRNIYQNALLDSGHDFKLRYDEDLKEK